MCATTVSLGFGIFRFGSFGFTIASPGCFVSSSTALAAAVYGKYSRRILNSLLQPKPCHSTVYRHTLSSNIAGMKERKYDAVA